MANRKKTMIADKFLDRRISNPRWVLHLGLHSTTTRSASTNTNLIPCEVLVPGVKKVAGFHFAMANIVLHICAYTWTFRRIVSSGTVIPIALYKPRPCSLISVQKATIQYCIREICIVRTEKTSLLAVKTILLHIYCT